MVTYFIGKALLCVGIVPGRRYTKAYFLRVISLGNNDARSLNKLCIQFAILRAYHIAIPK